MPNSSSPLREHARAIWQAAVDAANPLELVRAALARLEPALPGANRILVVGGGKAGAAMAAGVGAAAETPHRKQPRRDHYGDPLPGDV